MPKRKSEHQPMARRRSRRQTPDVPDETRQTPDAHVQSTGGETAGTQSAPSDGGKIPVHISDTQLRQLAEAISAGLDRGATPSSSTEPDLTFDENAGNGILDFPLSGSAEIGYHAGQVVSYSCELGYNVPNKIKLQISNGQYVNLAKLRPNASDPDDETQFLSVQDGSLAMASKPKAKLVNDIQTWTDLFLIFSSIYAAAHPECTTALFKYIHTVRLGASRSPGLGWRDYDVQFRLKKEQNPNMSFAIVDQELWLLYMQAPLLSPRNNPEQIGKCYDFNYRGVCQRRPCPYKHQCLRCSLNHPSTKCQLLKPPTNYFASRSNIQQSSSRVFSPSATNTPKPIQSFRRQ